MKRETSYPAISLLLLSSLVSGILWFNNSAIYPFIASDLGLGISVLGLMSAAFLAGVGLSQIPAGLLSMRIGSRDVIIIGTVVSSLASLATAVESSTVLLIILRFIVGMGLALLFTPGLSLIASYFPPGREGFGVGIYDSVSLVGGIFAYIGDVLMASDLGWRVALALNGAAGLVIGVAFFAILPRKRTGESSVIHVPKIRNVLLDRWLLTVGISLLGLEFASALVANFMVYFLSSGLKVSAIFSGVVTSIIPAAGVASSTVFGRIFDRTSRTKLLMLSLGILAATGLAVSALNDLPGSVLSTLMVGFFSSGGFIVCIAASRKLSEKHGLEYEILGISWAVTLSLFGSFFGPIFFSLAVVSFGYVTAWIISGLISAVFFVPLVFSLIRGYPNP